MEKKILVIGCELCPETGAGGLCGCVSGRVVTIGNVEMLSLPLFPTAPLAAEL